MLYRDADPKEQWRQFQQFCLVVGSFCEKEFPKYDKLVARTSATDVALARLVVDQEESLRSVQILHGQQFHVQANMVVRHMYENYINAVALAFLIDQRHSRRTLATRFIKYGAIVKWRHIEAIRRRIPDIASPDEVRLERKLEREAMRYFRIRPNKKGIRVPPKTWHPWGTFKGLHDQVRVAILGGRVPSSVYGTVDLFDWHYDSLYDYTNASIHSDWSSLTSQVSFKVTPPVMSVARSADGSSMFFGSVKLFFDTLTCFGRHKNLLSTIEHDLERYIG